GRDHDVQTGVGGGAYRLVHFGRHVVRVVDERPVDVEREKTRSEAHAPAPGGSSTSRPPRYGCSTAGPRTDPSRCWWFSSSAMIVRVLAINVPFSVAAAVVPLSVRIRVLSRRAWKPVQFDVDEISPYVPCEGIHVSQSNFRIADNP